MCKDAESVALAAARNFVQWAWQAIGQDGRFNVALSGGHTPEALFRVLASQEFRAQVGLGTRGIILGDERAVPPESKRK